MPKPLRNRVSGSDAFFFFPSRTALINLLTAELTAFFAIKEKEERKNRRG